MTFSLPTHPAWIFAVLTAQDSGDLKPLAQLLRATNFQLRRGEREYLAALFDRGKFQKGRGLPLGRASAEQKLKIVADFVRAKQAEKISQADAIALAVKRYWKWFQGEDAPGQRLSNYLNGRRGSSRRRKPSPKHPPSTSK
jgi:hypothetical protein